MSIVYKSIQEIDAKALKELFLSVEWSSGNYPEKLAIAMKNYGSVFTAWDEEKLVGLISSMDDGIMTAYVHYLLVHPDYQGKGYAKSLIDFIVEKYREQYAILQVGTGDSPLTIPFYEKCGFVRSHIIPNFFTDNYDHPIYEDGVQLVDMVYLQRQL